MTKPLSDADLDALERATLKARITAEQEIVRSQEARNQVRGRQPLIDKIAASVQLIRSNNHFGEDYEITMRRKNA